MMCRWAPVLLLAAFAVADDWDYSSVGEVRIATTQPDTVTFFDESWKTGNRWTFEKPQGVWMYAAEPFRYRVRCGEIEDANHSYVDTLWPEATGYVCELFLPVDGLDTLFVTPTASDTVWVRPLFAKQSWQRVR